MRYLRIGLFSIIVLLAWTVVGCSSGGAADEAASADAKAPASASASSTHKASAPATDMGGSVMTGESASAPAKKAIGGPQTRLIGSGAPNQTPVKLNRSVIRKASLTVSVKSVEESEHKADKVVTGLGGYVEGQESNNLNADDAQLTLTARIPVDKFDEALDQFEKLGARVSKKIASDDVTSKVLDYDARLKTMRAQEIVYQRMLSKARGLDDMESLQQRLMELREQIESTMAQLKGLSQLSDMSTIQLTLAQSYSGYVAKQDNKSWAGESWAQAKGTAFTFYKGVTVVLMWLLLFSPVVAAVVVVWRWLAKVAAPARSTPPPPPMQL